MDDVFLELNDKNIHSELVNQDVLYITGRNDHFVPFKMHGLLLMLFLPKKARHKIIAR